MGREMMDNILIELSIRGIFTNKNPFKELAVLPVVVHRARSAMLLACCDGMAQDYFPGTEVLWPRLYPGGFIGQVCFLKSPGQKMTRSEFITHFIHGYFRKMDGKPIYSTLS